MSKQVIILIVFLTLVLGAFGYLSLRPEVSSPTPSPTSTTPGSVSTAANPLPNEDKGGSYVTYEEGIIEQTPRRKILFFHAPWCPQCRAIEADILRDGVPSGLHVIKVDYDSNQNLRQKYGVTIQTTFVELDDEGNAIEKFVAYDQPTFKSVTLNFLSK